MAKIKYLLLLTCCASLSGGVEPYFIPDPKNPSVLYGEKRAYKFEEVCKSSETNKAPCILLKTEDYEALLLENANLKFHIDSKGF